MKTIRKQLQETAGIGYDSRFESSVLHPDVETHELDINYDINYVALDKLTAELEAECDHDCDICSKAQNCKDCGCCAVCEEELDEVSSLRTSPRELTPIN